MCTWTHTVRRVDLPAGRYEPFPGRAYATQAEAEAEALRLAAQAAGSYTPRIYEVRARDRRVIAYARVPRAGQTRHAAILTRCDTDR